MKRIIFIFLIASMVFALGPPVAAASDNFTIITYIAINNVTDGAGTISPAISYGNAGYYSKLATSAIYGMENATCMTAVSPVIKTSIVVISGLLNSYYSKDVITTATASTTASIYYGSYDQARSAGRYDETVNFTAYNPRNWRHDHLREISFSREGVTRAT